MRCRPHRRLLEDSAVNIDEWLAEGVEQCSPRKKALHSSPATESTNREDLSYNAVAKGSWRWGNIGYIATGVAGAFPASNPVRCADRPHLCAESRLPAERQLGDEPQDAGAIRKLKDATGNYLWQPPAQRAHRPR